MLNSNQINKILNKNILNGTKIPHSTSYPVIRQENDKYYLAVFVFFFTHDDIELGKVNRPTLWAIADIETGEIIEKRETSIKEFSDATYETKYDVYADGQYNTSKKYYEKAFLKLDFVRDKIINTGKFYRDEYQYYLDMILANIPKEYQRFYIDLSI